MQQQKAKLANAHKKMTQINTKSARLPQQAQRQGSHTKEVSNSHTPTFTPCSLCGPDGKVRPGWEMRIGDILFGRADSKESLLQYYTRIHEPMPSGHWRERSWQPQTRTAATRRPRREQDPYNDETEAEEADVAELWD
ncbi:MAG: hypothetical protein ACRERD_24885 [Candidatus Binatia bacterium]